MTIPFHVRITIGQWPGVVAVASLIVVGIRLEWAHRSPSTRLDLLTMTAFWMAVAGYTVFLWVLLASLFHWAL